MAAQLADSLVATEADRLEQAEAAVRNYCGWHIAPIAVDTITITKPRSATFVLPSLYVIEVTSITRDGELLDDSIYTWSPAGVVTAYSGVWSGDELVVNFIHGHDPVPPEVTAIVQGVAQRAVNNPGSLVREQRGPFAETYSQTGFNQSLPIALLDAEKDILRRYRIPAGP